MRWIAFGLLITMLTGCSDKAAEAERRLAMVKRAGSLGEVCEASREVARAHLEQGDEREYQLAQITSNLACNAARMDGWNSAAQQDLRERASAQADAMEEAFLQAAEQEEAKD